MSDTWDIHERYMRDTCICSCISHVFLMYFMFFIGFLSQKIHERYMRDTWEIHWNSSSQPDYQCIWPNTWEMYLKNQCIFRLWEIPEKYMYFSCISHVFLMYLLKITKKSSEISMYISCISHVSLMYFGPHR